MSHVVILGPSLWIARFLYFLNGILNDFCGHFHAARLYDESMTEHAAMGVWYSEYTPNMRHEEVFSLSLAMKF